MHNVYILDSLEQPAPLRHLFKEEKPDPYIHIHIIIMQTVSTEPERGEISSTWLSISVAVFSQTIVKQASR